MLNRTHPILCLVTDRRRLCAGCDEAAIGRCVIAQLREAVEAGIDLVQIRERDLDAGRLAGTVFATVSKPGAGPTLGDAGLADVARASAAPVLAIGGVTIERLPRVAAAGAAGVAGIGLFLSDAAAARCRAGPLHAIVTAA